MKEMYEYKLDLLYYGVSVSTKSYAALKKGTDGQINNDDYITTKRLMILLDEQLYVNANLDDNSMYSIDYFDNQFFLLYKMDIVCSVKIVQPPDFALNKVSISTKELITTLVNIHGDRLRLQPIQGCSNNCKFCDINKFNYKEHAIEELDEAFIYALNSVSFRHVLISGGTPRESDESYNYLNNVYKFFGEKYGKKYPIDVMMVPRGLTINDNNVAGYKEFLEKLKSWNIKGLSINLELNNLDIRKRLIPQKNLIGKDKYLEFIKLAVNIFGLGNVRSCIIIGLESMEDSLNAVRQLCEVGCMPVLSPYVPNNINDESPTPKFMKEILSRTRKIIDEYSIELGPLCESCRHNTIHYK